MSQLNMGKKVFFLYPPVDFTKTVVRRLFQEGFEIYVLNRTDKVEPLLRVYPDSLLFINSDYPYEEFRLQDFNDQVLSQPCFEELQVYSIFSTSVTYASRIRDYLSLEQPEEELYRGIREILDGAEAHGKREQVRFGSYDQVLGRISFDLGGEAFEADLHDISPKGISFSLERDLSGLLEKPMGNIALQVGAYRIVVEGVLSQKRRIAGRSIYVALFEGEAHREELFDFVYTSLEKDMDEFLQTLEG